MLKYCLQFLSVLVYPPFWLFMLWFTPLIIILTFVDDPVSRIYQYFWLYKIAFISGWLFILWHGVRFSIALSKKQVKKEWILLVYFVFGIMVIYYNFYYFHQMKLYQGDIVLYETGNANIISGKIVVEKEPCFTCRSTDYIYHLNINGKQVGWYQKQIPEIDKSQNYIVKYLPNTNQVISVIKK